MLPFLSLHTLAAQRGDGLRAELLALLVKHHARSDIGLSAAIECDEAGLPGTLETGVADKSARKEDADG
jgi:hypothetical protein